LKKITVPLTAIAIIVHIGPVAATGTPMPLKRNASVTFWSILP
jgi:hypothetical protein